MIPTTLVGSFPLDYNRENIKRALIDQYEVGITFPVLPQLRDFVYMYVEPLVNKGVLSYEHLGYEVRGDILSVEPEPPEDIVYAVDIAEDLGIKYRLAFTGPFTIASRLTPKGGKLGDIKSSLLAHEDLFSEFFDYLVEMARQVSKVSHPHVVCVDEPVLSVIVGAKSIMFGLEPNKITQVLDRLLGQFKSPLRGVHVCSRLPPLLKNIILPLRNANFLDHEHSDIPENRKYYSREELNSASKALGYGIISSRNTRVEEEQDVMALAKEALDTYGAQLVFLKPDCGFGGMRGFLKGKEYEEIVLRKLKILVNVAKGLGEQE
jgi:5-methyltetrahydropteroyltriglutamate--homocysteine methyltransferase